MTLAKSVPVRYVGVDCARGGGDKSVLTILRHKAPRYHVEYIREWQNLDGPQLATEVGRVVDKLTWTRMGVDVIGVGASAYDNLKRMYRRRVHPFAASNKVDGDDLDKKRYANFKAQVAGELVDEFRAGNIVMPDHEDLKEDCLAMRRDLDQHGKLRVVDPNASPDHFDSLLIAYAAAHHFRSRVWVHRRE